MGELLQMMPHPSRRGAEHQRNEIIDAKLEQLLRELGTASRSGSQADHVEDRLVPQVFAAKITGATLQIPVSGRTWWEYDWEEVERVSSGGTWSTVTNGRTSVRSGKSWNAYETSIDDDGGNIGPSGVVRLEYPTDAIVPMWIDPAGRAWFNEANPIEVICDDSGALSDGDKSDISVSGSGTTWVIKQNAVTFAKMQDVSTNVLLGNDASGTDVEEIQCTAAGRAILDDADASAQRTTLGLGTTDTPKFAGVSMANDEFITNSTNGRLEFRPAPTGANIHGFVTDFATTGKVRIGTIRSSDNVLNQCPLESSTDFDIAAGYAFGLGGQASRTWYMQKNNPSGTLGRMIFSTTVNNVDHTGCFIFGQIGTQNSANRSPASQTNAMVYVYSADLTNANDFVRIFHDQTNGTVNCGDGNLILSGATGVRINGSFGFAVAPTAVQTGYTTFTNLTTDRTCDANATTVDELADILGTLIEDLKAKGIISA